MRKVLITGASRGIGKAIAEKFKEEGYILVCPTRQEMDLSDPRSVEVYIANHKDEYFDVIVNNAGVNEINEITQIKDDELTTEFVLPDAFDPRVGKEVSAAVAKAARETGVARI